MEKEATHRTPYGQVCRKLGVEQEDWEKPSSVPSLSLKQDSSSIAGVWSLQNNDNYTNIRTQA